MGLIKKLSKKLFNKKVAGLNVKHHLFGPLGFTHRKSFKNFRKKLGLTGSNKWSRSFKRSLRGLRSDGVVSSYQPTSASSYQHQSRTLSQLTGGV